MDDIYSSFDDSKSSGYNNKKTDVSLSDQLAEFGKLRISALTNAAEISPFVKEVTIGPNSPPIKDPVQNMDRLTETPPKIKEEENLMEDRIREDLRYTLIMREFETKLQQTSEESFRELIEQMIAKRAEISLKYWKAQSEECERRALERKKRKLLLLQQLADNDNQSLLERAKLDEQNTQLINRQTMDNLNRMLEEQNKATARLAAITDSHTKICLCYSEINNLIQTEPLVKEIYEKYRTAINTVIGNINVIMESCKNTALTDREVKQAEILVLNIDNICKKIINDLQEFKKKKQREEEDEVTRKKELEEKELLEAKAKEEAEKAQQAELAALLLDQSKKTKPIFHSAKNFSNYEDLKNFLVQYELQYKELLENVNMKKFRFDCQKAVNTPVNAISSVSGIHMKDKYEKLSKLLKGERVQVLDTYVQATQHPQGLAYCTALLAKKIVRQGDLLVSSKPEAAFPLAAVTVALSSQFPTFSKLLEANFHRQCPYLVPMFLPQKEGQTDKEFYLSRGYTYNDEGVVEKQDKFLKRMSGIFRLCCAIWIAKTPRFVNAPNPHGLFYGWRWLASFINLRPEPDISATLLHDFFSVCGHEFFKHYGKQFTKIIKLIATDYLAILQNIDEGGPKSRLEVFLQNVLRTGHIEPASGLLQPNTW
ncbi:mRNA export factor Gle1 [Plodia interpunctella]|uniref:mRNA export factor Gle1 n=1 Tax=Plodia interpunctella TaxID=58824 RepID=UPI0023680ACB|nr:mRNA export factor Gle1 [Plodia interpunctella]